MKKNIFQTLEQIINVTSMTNKWMRWCEQKLPEQSVFVPSVFQMRDAYSHMISMYAQGIEEQGLALDEKKECEFDEVSFFASEVVEKQFSEIGEHTLRAFFDTADYIVESLIEIGKNAPQTYPLLCSILNKYDNAINELRAKKSLPPDKAYLHVQKWDSILQLVTSAYSFADYENIIWNLHSTVCNVALDIEERFEESVIKEYNPKFFEEKMLLSELRELPVEYRKFENDEESFSKQILEDPIEWQQKITDEFNLTKKKLNEQLKKYQMLLEALPSTALIRKTKSGEKKLASISFWVVSTILSTLITTLVGKKLFFTNGTNVQVDYIFLGKICLLFIAVEVILIMIRFLLGKIGISLAKRKFKKQYTK